MNRETVVTVDRTSGKVEGSMTGMSGGGMATMRQSWTRTGQARRAALVASLGAFLLLAGGCGKKPDGARAAEEKSAGPAGAPATAPRAAAPPWAGVYGQLSLALKKVVYSNTFEASDVTGTLRIDAGAAKLENVRAALALAVDIDPADLIDQGIDE